MVAMGTSLSDGAWGRESAVYRITGVLTVIGGWFFTAFCAFLASFCIATLIFFGKLPVILVLILISIFILISTHAFHRRKIEKQERKETEMISHSLAVLKSCDKEVQSTIGSVSKILFMTYTALSREKHKELRDWRTKILN